MKSVQLCGSFTHLYAEFQRITRRDKKAFLSEQWKELEENNRMGKTRDVYKSYILQKFENQPQCLNRPFSLEDLQIAK